MRRAPVVAFVAFLIAPAAASAQTATTAAPGVRFRGGGAVAAGAEFASGFGVGLGGVEGRAGVQFNDLIALYAQPWAEIGAGTIARNGQTGSLIVTTGTGGISGLVDFTFADRFFVAGGGGVGIVNNPVGPEFHLRIGAYPVMTKTSYGRRGLSVGLDFRMFFMPDTAGFFVVGQTLASVGYEWF